MPRLSSRLALTAAMTAIAAYAAAPDFAAVWKTWHAERVAGLQKPRGWLALSGMHWLSEGKNVIDGLPGTFHLAKGQVTLAAKAGDGYRLDGNPITSRVLVSDEGGKDEVLQVGAHRALALIQRGPKLALRVWDAERPERKSFAGVDAFAADPRWRIAARWEAYPAPRSVEVPSVIGVPSKAMAPGRAHFSVDGKEVTLEPTAEGSGLFFVFKDQTAAKETYGAGRFLGAGAPKDGTVVLDFNRAVNPPCAFTPYATCPLPRPENVLPVRISAGEKRPAGH